MASSTQIETATTDLCQSGSAMPPTAETTESKAITPGCQNQQMIGQIVLKWDKASLLSGLSDPALLSGEYLAAMHCLIKRIAQLQSAHEQPQGPITDPEILLPLVLQEAQAVLKVPDRYQADISPSDSVGLEQGSVSTVFSPSALGSHPVQPIQTLAPWLLWRIAQGTHETMQLLEGIAAQVSLDRQTWHSGMVRLVACLEIQTAQTPLSLDLVTFQTAPPSLPDRYFIQIQASLLGQQTLSVKALLQRLMPQLTATAPILQSFLAGFPIDLLVPHQAWQPGQVCLRLELEFISTELPNPGLSAFHSTDSLSTDSLPTIKFTHPDWLEQHITTVVEDQLTRVLLQQKPEMAQKSSAKIGELAALTAIVHQGCAAIDELQRSLTLASRTFAQQVLSLDDLALRLLWGMNRTAYEVTHWLSGVQVRLLQPQSGWTTGTLRFGIYLVLRTPDQVWRFDLVQRCLTAATQAVAEDAIVQLGDWGCFQLLTLSDLAAEIWRQVSQTMPEILLLCSETEVNVTVADLPGQLGVLQFQTAFEFSASGSFKAA